jgi:hypothetical protein
MKTPTPSFSLHSNDVVLSDPEVLADRLAEFLRAHVRPDPTDRDLILMFVDRLFLGLCDDFEDEELMRGAHVQFPALSKDQVVSLRAMQARANETKSNEIVPNETQPEAMAAKAGSDARSRYSGNLSGNVALRSL